MIEIVSITKNSDKKRLEYLLGNGWEIIHHHGNIGVITFVLYKRMTIYALVGYEQEASAFHVFYVTPDRHELGRMGEWARRLYEEGERMAIGVLCMNNGGYSEDIGEQNNRVPSMDW